MKRLAIGIIIVLTILFAGTAGYRTIGAWNGKDWSLVDCLYMTAITITTVGYGEVLDGMDSPELRGVTRPFSMILMIFGMGILLYAVSMVTASIVEGDLISILRRRKMLKEIEKLENHFIVCGAGRIGYHIAEELFLTKRPFVVIDTGDDKSERLKRLNEDIIVFPEDALDDDTLITAGIKRARGLAATLPDDKDNLYLTMTAHQLNPALRIVAKSVEEKSEKKLLQAGAASVVSPNFIGGLRVVSEMLRPKVVTFLDIMMRGKDPVMRIEEHEIAEGSSLAGRTLAESNIPRQTGVLVLAIKRADTNDYVFNPGSDAMLDVGSVLVVQGSTQAMEKLRRL